MRPARIRYLIVFFAAMFLANTAVASARACMVQLAAQEHTSIRSLDSSGDEHLCPEADSAANCLTHCTQSYKSDQQNLSFDAPAIAFAPPPLVHRAWVPIEPRRLVLASAPPVVGPPLTILFGNLRI
jgi:hypothetical protein